MSRGRKPAPSPISVAVSAEVRAEAGRLHMTTRALAEASGVKAGRLGYLLRDEASWNLVELDQVAVALGLSTVTLLERANATGPAASEDLPENVVALLAAPGPGVRHPALESVTRYPDSQPPDVDSPESRAVARKTGRKPHGGGRAGDDPDG